MDKRQLRLRCSREAVGLADRVGHPFAQSHHQIGALHLAEQCRRHANPHIATKVRMRCIKELRPSMGRADRQYPSLGQAIEIGKDRFVMHCVGQ